MKTNTKVPLVLSEITSLWNEYMNDSSAICLFKYFLNDIDDEEIRSVLQHALTVSEEHIKYKNQLMEQEDLAIPVGYTDQDVNINAPRLFTDSYYLLYLKNMLSFSLEGYSLVLRYVTRPDIRDHFSKCLVEAIDMYNKVVDVELSKGLTLRVPRAEVKKRPIFPKDTSILKGLLIENPRPMYAREVVNTFSGITMDIFVKATLIAFAKVVDTQLIKEHLLKGRDIVSKHLKGFISKLANEDLPTPSTYESYVTDSIISPFSNKLIMTIVQQLLNFGLIVDGSATAFSLRSDITALHLKCAAEIGKYAMDGLKIMINNGWFEQPPQVVNHDSL
ncbi:MAG: DUF3231 family protein [Bacillota bacterium]|nr:DUF3231 family protein [Bacillota bacterium]